MWGIVGMSMVMAGVIWLPLAWGAGHHMLEPRVPVEHLAEARALKNPLPDSPDTVERGKALYHGKGTCFNCHGPEGGGDGPVASQLDPPPRNFQHHGFWRHRTEGEIFWVVKNGSPGTGMAGFASQLTDEEIWAVIQYEQTFSRHGRRGMRGMGGRGPMGRMGPGGGQGEGPMGKGEVPESEPPSQEETEKTPLSR